MQKQWKYLPCYDIVRRRIFGIQQGKRAGLDVVMMKSPQPRASLVPYTITGPHCLTISFARKILAVSFHFPFTPLLPCSTNSQNALSVSTYLHQCRELVEPQGLPHEDMGIACWWQLSRKGRWRLGNGM